MILGHLITSDLFYNKWNDTRIIIKDRNDKEVFELRYNAILLKDDLRFINDDNKFTNEIYKYKLLSIEFLENETIIKIEKNGE